MHCLCIACTSSLQVPSRSVDAALSTTTALANAAYLACVTNL